MKNILFRQRGETVESALVFFHPINTCVSSQSTKLMSFRITDMHSTFSYGAQW